MLADARAEVESMRRRRDDIAAELTQLSGVIEALAVSERSESNDTRGADMTQPDHQFRVVMRGYDPADVDRAISGLQSARPTREASASRSSPGGSRPAPRREAGPAEPPTFDHLGERVGPDPRRSPTRRPRSCATRRTPRSRTSASTPTRRRSSVRDEADQYADQSAATPTPRPPRSLADARRAADEERDAAERDAAALRQEAEAVYEQQRANAAQAAADFETTLAERRDRTTAEFQEQQAATQAQLDAMAARVEDTRPPPSASRRDAEAEARRMVLEAEERAANLARDARAAADRVRTESDRELAAATQRRDSINAQLTNVRQMLATLTGSAAGFAVDPLPDADRPRAGGRGAGARRQGDRAEAEEAAPEATEAEADEVPEESTQK